MFCFIYYSNPVNIFSRTDENEYSIFFFDVQVPSPKVDEVGYKYFFLIGRSHWEPTLVVI